MTANVTSTPDSAFRTPHSAFMAAGAALVLLLGAGCGTRPANRAGVGPAAGAPAAAPAVAAPVASMAATASRTVSPVDNASEAPAHVRTIHQPAWAAEGCEAQVYELALAVTSRKDAGGARMVTCLVLDLGDLSVRTVELVQP